MLRTDLLVYLGAFLFCTGLTIAIIKRNVIMVLLGIELMLNGSNVNLIAFNQQHGEALHGHIFALFVIIVAVSEAAIGLAIILRVYRYYQSSVPDQISDLKD
ncbi:MAG TPA: NADH-quinone oxidoreductase subunit NuoK [Chryseosolibacter sp.]